MYGWAILHAMVLYAVSEQANRLFYIL
uniref:Uncharacterized protein n=1 Tax=Arundo donax TaxID=35708 RepID=A0A0A9BMQ0_ARUDO